MTLLLKSRQKKIRKEKKIPKFWIFRREKCKTPVLDSRRLHSSKSISGTLTWDKKNLLTARRKATWQDDKHGEYKSAFMWGAELAWMRGGEGRDGLAFVTGQVPARGDGHEHELCRVPLCSAAAAFISCHTPPRVLGARWQLPFRNNPGVLSGRGRGKEEWKVCSALCAQHLEITAHYSSLLPFPIPELK